MIKVYAYSGRQQYQVRPHEDGGLFFRTIMQPPLPYLRLIFQTTFSVGQVSPAKSTRLVIRVDEGR